MDRSPICGHRSGSFFGLMRRRKNRPRGGRLRGGRKKNLSGVYHSLRGGRPDRPPSPTGAVLAPRPFFSSPFRWAAVPISAVASFRRQFRGWGPTAHPHGTGPRRAQAAGFYCPSAATAARVPKWAQSGPTLGPLWAHLKPKLAGSHAFSRRHRAQSGPTLGPDWGHFGPTMGPNCDIARVAGPFPMGILGPFWAQIGPTMGPLWAQ